MSVNWGENMYYELKLKQEGDGVECLVTVQVTRGLGIGHPKMKENQY